MLDLLIQNGQAVTDAGMNALDIGVRDGKICALEPNLSQHAAKTIDATGKLIFPGFIDAHTHMGIPIMNTHSIDDFESGSIAAAFGGVTTIVDFTVQEKGQTLRESIQTRIDKARNRCHVDYSLHVNVTDQPEQCVQEIPALIEEGFRFYKVFSTYRQAGMMITWEQFRLVLNTVNKHGGLLFLHAEDNSLIESCTEQNVATGNLAPIYHPRSRTPEAEAKAITDAARIAGELDAMLYIVHLSSKAGLEAGLKAREQGVKLILETCPQYLVLSEACYRHENGHYWITTPPLRTKEDSEALWQALAAGELEVVATDHCPFTMKQKEAGMRRFHLTPNGIPGVETLFPLLYSYGVAGGRISQGRLVEVLAKRPAEIFGLYPQKGTVQVGADADLIIWDPNQEYEISADKMHGKADWSPYEGLTIKGRLDYTILRGQVLVEKGQFEGDLVLGELLTRYKKRC